MESLARLVAIIVTAITAVIAAPMVWFIKSRYPNLQWQWLWIVPACVLTAFGAALMLLRVISF